MILVWTYTGLMILAGILAIAIRVSRRRPPPGLPPPDRATQR